MTSQLLYALLLAATVLAGTLYSSYYLGTAGSVSRARIPGSHQHVLNLPSYFADKRNIFNQWFVKLGWAWTTLAFLFCLLARPQYSFRAFLKPVLRYSLATAYWLLFVAWFFGPSLTDRVLLATGAKCIPASHLHSNQSLSPQALDSVMLNPELCMTGGRKLFQATRKTQVLSTDGIEGLAPKGTPFFIGGHDLSGHLFILTHASLFLVAEMSPLIPYLLGTKAQKRQITSWQRALGLSAAGLVGLWWFMLLNTSIFFHSPFEKFTGFFVGTLGAVFGQWIVGT